MSDWRDQAACQGYEDIFVPDEPAPAGVAQAKEICATCPVFAECKLDAERKLAMVDDEGHTYTVELYGVFAGKFYAPSESQQGADRAMERRHFAETKAAEVVALWNDGLRNKTEIGLRLGISKTTVRKYLNESGVAA